MSRPAVRSLLRTGIGPMPILSPSTIACSVTKKWSNTRRCPRGCSRPAAAAQSPGRVSVASRVCRPTSHVDRGAGQAALGWQPACRPHHVVLRGIDPTLARLPAVNRAARRYRSRPATCHAALSRSRRQPDLWTLRMEAVQARDQPAHGKRGWCAHPQHAPSCRSAAGIRGRIHPVDRQAHLRRKHLGGRCCTIRRPTRPNKRWPSQVSSTAI